MSLLTTSDVAERLSTPTKRVGRQQVAVWIRKGVKRDGTRVKLKAIRMPDNGYRVEMRDLDDFLSKLTGRRTRARAIRRTGAIRRPAPSEIGTYPDARKNQGDLASTTTSVRPAPATGSTGR
jgi:hypothetical protein